MERNATSNTKSDKLAKHQKQLQVKQQQKSGQQRKDQSIVFPLFV
jgi:hypothetical protein